MSAADGLAIAIVIAIALSVGLCAFFWRAGL